jgi:galactitol-specific phosphotransferase system IIB component
VTDILADTAAIDARLPSDPADESLVIAATTAIYDRIGAPAGASVSADVAAVKVDTADIRVTTDKLDNTLELTSDGYIFTVNGLQNAPSGTGASQSAIADEVQTRTIAAVTVVNGLAANVITAAATAADFTTEVTAALATSAALTSVAGDVTAVKAKTDNLPTDPADQSLIIAATNALAALLGTPAGASVSADVAAVKAETAAILTDTAEIGAAGAGLTALATAAALATVDTNVDSILADTGTDGVVVAAASKTGYQLSATGVDDILDEAVDGATTLRQSVRLSNSALGGKASGLATTEATFRDLADTKDRLVATVDADGNRSAVTRDLT